MAAAARRPSRSRRAPGDWWATNAERTVGEVDEEGLPLQKNEGYVEWDAGRYIATITEREDGAYHVHYHGWKARYDETLSLEQIQRRAPGWAARDSRKRGRTAAATPSPPSQPRRRAAKPQPKPAQRRAPNPAAALHRALSEVDRRVWAGEEGAPTGRDAVHEAYELLCAGGQAELALGPAADLAIAAAETGHVECLRRAYELGGAAALCKADAEQRTAAQCAAKHGHDECLRVIAQCGGQSSLSAVSGTAGSPAHWAAMRGRDGTLRVLHELGASLSCRARLPGCEAAGFTPAHAAAAADQPCCLRQLDMLSGETASTIDCKAERLTATATVGFAPVHLAAQCVRLNVLFRRVCVT